METNRLIHLLAKKIGKNISVEEEEELRRLLKSKPEFTFFSALLDTVESEKQTHHPVKDDDLVADNWDLLSSNLDTDKRELSEITIYPWHRNKGHQKWRIIWQRAAVWISILLFAGSGFWLISDNKKSETELVSSAKPITRTTNTIPKRFVLPDGSVVWLNSKSSIRYVENNTGDKREVYLQGEAYFDVVHDAGHPFIVHAGNVDIQVLGTAFNVQAYKNEGKVETTLINGKIKVQIAGNPDKSFVLTPNEKLTIQMDVAQVIKKITRIQPDRIKTVKFKVEELKPPVVTQKLPEVAWLKDKLVFQNERFDELTKRLERRFGVTIVFKDATLKNERLNGIFKNENIQKALKILQMTTPFKYEIKGDTVYLSR